MGSAHFLTAALDRIADRVELFLAEVGGLPGIDGQLKELSHDNASTPRPEDGDLLRRLILKRCIYGVDLSPMAVEVANITLWLASFVPGLALSYLSDNLKCGDALVGIADAGAVGASDSPLLTGRPVNEAMARAADIQHRLAENPDRTPDEVKRSEELSEDLRNATAGLRSAFDLWTAEPLGLNGARHVLETHSGTINGGDDDENSKAAAAVDAAAHMAGQYRFFHWPLEFPSVFHRARPGFDVVVGNPPWNEVTIEELGFYALREPGLRGLSSPSARRQRIAELDNENPAWRGEFERERRHLAALRGFFSESGGYRLQGAGDKDLYQLFCERYNHLVRQGGRFGVVLPRTAFLTVGAKGFRQWLFRHTTVATVDFLQNSGRWAFDMEARYTVALLAGQYRPSTASDEFHVTGPSANLEEFRKATGARGVKVRLSALGDTLVVPLLPSQRHADLLAKLRGGVRFDTLTNPDECHSGTTNGRAAMSPPTPCTELHETKEGALFSYTNGDPAWKGRSFDQYDPHGSGPAGHCVWNEVFSFVQKKRRRSPIFKRLWPKDFLEDVDTHPINFCRVAFGDVSNRTNSRTVIACLVPPKIPLTNKAPYLLFAEWSCLAQSAVLGIMNSLPFDWAARRYVETNLNFFILNLLPVPPAEILPWRRIGELAARLSCVDPRFSEFAAEAGVACGPLSPAQRDDLRAEIDALVARAYGLTADELQFIFTDFTENAVSRAYRELTLTKFEKL